jgi:hypothetical protein
MREGAGVGEGRAQPLCHDRPWAGYPRLCFVWRVRRVVGPLRGASLWLRRRYAGGKRLRCGEVKSWVAGPRPAMTLAYAACRGCP